MPNGYNFTERSRSAFALARDEAARLGHRYVDADHILLGIIREGEGLGAVILMALAAARELEHTYVATEHLLLGFLREGQAHSIPLLASLGVTLDRTRETLLRLLGDPRASAV